ncbi:hypothetical protein AAG589_11340 [Isoptericola sp. F-RaC21]|uniref:hypothetical protein n=1 Tax=Isoptericola sp. F-RaC21 TaxID=3141452 RepID=UPI00315C0F2A
MTTSTTTAAPARRAPARRAPAAAATAAARNRFVRTLTVGGTWFWGCWAALVLALPLAVERWGGEADGLTYDAAGDPARWVPFAIGIVLTAGLLTVHLSAGGTRRSFLGGGARAGALVGVGFGVLVVLLTLAEERLYTSLDRPWQGSATPLGLDTPVGVGVTVVGETFVVVTYLLVGVAVGAGYRRLGAWRGTLLVVPLLVPCALVDLVTRTGIFGIPLRGGYDHVALGAVLTVVGGAAAAALAAAVAHRMLRDVPLRP